MSKSLGNSPDPLDLIAKYGADGLRFGLLRIAPQGQDIRFDEAQVVEGRNFCNKLWNACRFRQMQGPLDPSADPSKHTLGLLDRAILARCDRMISRVDQAYDEYRFSEIAQALYDFVWGDFCDRYLEAVKADFRSEDAVRKAAVLAVIDSIIHRVLILLHPYIPFVTEELWKGLALGADTIQFEKWPKTSGWEDEEAVNQTDMLFDSITAARNTRSTYQLPSAKSIAWKIHPRAPWVGELLPAVKVLLNASELLVHQGAPPAQCATTVTSVGDFYLPLAGLLDPGEERARLEKELLKVEAEIAKVATKLSNENFVRNAPAEVIEEHRLRQESWQQRMADIRRALDSLL
jgi:valyl-tRNA synthetase